MSKIAVIGIAGNSVFLPVENFHVGGETVEAHSVHFEPGGKGFNQAVAAARSGAEVSFLAAVGSDGKDSIRAFLDRENINSVLVDKEQATAFAAIITDKSGSNHVTVYQGAQLSPEDVDSFEGEIKNADILLLSNEVAENINVRAIELAKKHGIKVVLNPAPARETCGYILENVDLFTPNEHETLGIEDKTNVVMTLGKRGCLVKEYDKIIPAVDRGKVVDTTGAGDTFNGVLCAMLAGGFDICFASTMGNNISSIGVTRKNAASSIPTKEEIREVFENLKK